MDTLKRNSAFCPDCGSILPPLRETGGIMCYACSRLFDPESLFDKGLTVDYVVHFNTRSTKSQVVNNKESNTGEEGPVVDRKCPRCGNEKMSYATLQLRSADEGQTVFYTCTKCEYKESENS
ncbi:DNA-directed RNA polymerase I subunit RPA12 [Cylas formicarius]|uniref:DNA-directed RNA polymerase I subunit RPA12 n=1 Tax=Cylas formicarius TaxID=197179 RepID=UPI002958643D|nr:DNA-directed RNA polymerase I subunit RPA12 [Cylas formicarius]